MYKNDEFDIAGFALGAVERKRIKLERKIKRNSIIIGLESNGFHSNGFSLIREIISEKKISLKTKTTI